MKITWVNHGIASLHSDGCVEVNKNLKKYPQLLKSILKHEMEHIQSDRLIDLWVDFKDLFNFRKQFELFMFSLRYPRALTEMLPVYPTAKKGLAVNYLLVVFYGLLLVLAIGG